LFLFRERRDKTAFFAPDFQAQLMEEEIGPAYFRVWQSLETDVYGPVHAGLAELASRGRLAAIITTNFDRLIETALRDRGQAFRVFHDQQTFADLATRGEGDASALPVIKIHGTIEDATSLVDTLRQRLMGRPEPLMNALQALLRRHPWLFLGFSGADFSYDAHYLGILDAAADATGFVFLAPPATSIQAGVRTLAEAYGAEKAAIIHADLATWLSDNFRLTPNVAVNAANGHDATQRIRDRIGQWLDDLGPMAVVNILSSMLKSSGMGPEALLLMRKTWRSYRRPDDAHDPSYARYNYNYGMALLERGFVRNPIALADDMSNVGEWREHADQNAFEYLARSYDASKLPVAGAQLACVLAYRGQVGEAIALAADVTDEALARNAKLELCDIAIASAVIYDIVQMFTPAVAQLRRCLQAATDFGDEPRRAMLCALLGRFLTYGRHFEEADRFIAEADRIGRRLDLRPVLLASQAARGAWLADSDASAESAVRTLQDVVATIDALDDVPLAVKADLLQPDSAPTITKGRHSMVCRILLDLNRAAAIAGDADAMNRALDVLDELVTGAFLGYCPHYYLAHAECLHIYGDETQRAFAVDLVRRARRLGEDFKNPWVAQAADVFEARFAAES
jgi:SIR2-like domain